jgi:predicted nucleotidyltransferase
MSDASRESQLEKVVRLLDKHGVVYLVVGGQAEYLMGSPRPTFDVDICYQRTKDNLARLAAALREVKPTLRGAPRDLPFRLDAESLAMGSNFTFDTEIEKLDLLGWVEPLGDYDVLTPRAELYDFAGFKIKTIGLEDLIRVKQHIARQKDSESLYQLLAIRRVREELQADGKNPRGNPGSATDR